MRPMQMTCTETASLGSYAVFFWTAVEGSILKVDIDEVISDQLPDIEVNKLPVGDGTAGSTDWNNPMLMGNRSDDKAYLHIKASVDPVSLASAALIGVRREGTTTILDSHAVVPSGKTPLSFSPVSRGMYEVVAGVDADSSGTLVNSEVCSVFPQKVLTITQVDYDSDMDELTPPAGVVWLLAVGIAVDYLSEFHSAGAAGAQLPGATRTFVWQLPTDPTHPLGQVWLASQPNNEGICPLNTFADGSAFSDLIESTDQVEGLIEDELESRKTEVQTRRVP